MRVLGREVKTHAIANYRQQKADGALNEGLVDGGGNERFDGHVRRLTPQRRERKRPALRRLKRFRVTANQSTADFCSLETCASQNKLLAQKQSALYCFCSASQIRKESAMAQTTVNLPRSITDEVRAEAKRLDRNIQWVLIQAWRAGRPAIKKLKAPPKAITGERNEDESS